MSDKCMGLGRIFGHKFKARHNEEISGGKWPFTEGTIESKLASTEGSFEKEKLIIATQSRKSTYLGDICVRCGKQIKVGEIK